MDDLYKLVYKYALINGIKHKGKAQEGAVVGTVMSFHPEMRKNVPKIVEIAKEVVGIVNSMKSQVQLDELEKIGGKIEEKKIEEKKLPELINVEGEVVLRFAPNPSGPLHIGHARAAILNHEYMKKYDGKLILRIEDTDPRRVDTGAYDMIEEDLKWLGVDWQDKIIQSDRIPIYYEYAEKLIKMGFAYMCTCKGAEFKKLKDLSNPCPCRDLETAENLRRWNDMENMPEGEAVLRVKTDLNHKNPAIRDWVAMRIVEYEHPRIGSQFKIYPMMNFSVAIDDHLLGITHVLRGKDHLANSEKQRYIYKHFGWDVPVFIHYGRLKMEDIQLSTSKARLGIKEGVYNGWDDPRLGTIRAIARRGITRAAIYNLMIEIGLKIADSTISWKKIYGLNRKVLEEAANRYFFVWDPSKVIIGNLPERSLGIIKRSMHPDFQDRGYRKIPFDGKVYLVDEDVKLHKYLRLMDAVNVYFKDKEAFFHSLSLEEARDVNAQIVHWVPAEDNLKAEVVMPDASVLKGLAEPSCADLKVDDVVQLERFGFARVDEVSERKIRFYFAHK